MTPYSPSPLLVLRSLCAASSADKGHAAPRRYHTCQRDLFKENASAVTQYCEVTENPNFGFQHFDHIGGAILAIFQVSSVVCLRAWCDSRCLYRVSCCQIAAPDGSYDVIHNSIQSEPGVVRCACGAMLRNSS